MYVLINYMECDLKIRMYIVYIRVPVEYIHTYTFVYIVHMYTYVCIHNDLQQHTHTCSSNCCLHTQPLLD